MNTDTSMNKPKQITGLVVSLLIVFGIASLGGYLPISRRTPGIPALPSLPGLVEHYDWHIWTILYTLMAIAAWIVWRRAVSGPTIPARGLCRTARLNVGWSALSSNSEPRFGSLRNQCFVGSNSGNHRVFLEGLETGRRVDGPISDLG